MEALASPVATSGRCMSGQDWQRLRQGILARVHLGRPHCIWCTGGPKSTELLEQYLDTELRPWFGALEGDPGSVPTWLMTQLEDMDKRTRHHGYRLILSWEKPGEPPELGELSTELRNLQEDLSYFGRGCLELDPTF